MSTSLHSFKDAEAKVHEQLYNNILLLTKQYPTTKDFDDVFRRDMFFKNNKAAFHQIIYYLLNVLDPQKTKEKIEAWPIYDIKQESKFRSEILSYTNQLNSIYDNANIPNIMASHLISPGGYKFVRFMLKLSQLVLYEHLKKNTNTEILYPIKPNKNHALTNISLKTVKVHTKVIEEDIGLKLEKFNEFAASSVDIANEIIAEQTKLNQDLCSIIALKEEKHQMLQEQKSFPLTSNNEKLTELEAEAECIGKVKEIALQCNQLTSHLMSKNSVLEYNRDDLKHIPGDVSRIVGNQPDNLNLPKLFEGFSMYLEHQHFKLGNYNEAYLNDMTQTIANNIGKYSQLEQRIHFNKADLSEAVDTFPHTNSAVPSTIASFTPKKYADSPLAKTLEQSTISDLSFN